MGEKARAKTMEKREAVSFGFTVELWGDKHQQFVERMPKAGPSGNSTRDASYKKRNKARKKKAKKGAVQKKTKKTGRKAPQANKSRSKSRAKGKYRT